MLFGFSPYRFLFEMVIEADRPLVNTPGGVAGASFFVFGFLNSLLPRRWPLAIMPSCVDRIALAVDKN